MAICEWGTETDSILARLTNGATLKICVKTKDESTLTRGWIEHHANIVGYENLIIADNGSTDVDTLNIYEEYAEKIVIFRFAGEHNMIHWHPKFLPLFDMMRRTCKYFSFIDIDERLVYLRDSEWIADSNIRNLLDSVSGIVPTTWLINCLNSMDRFSFLDTEGRDIILNNLRWGKPILPASKLGVSTGIHNIQFIDHEFTDSVGVNLFLLHYTQVPEERIARNRRKLLSRNVVNLEMSDQEIVDLDMTGCPDGTVLRFQNEIREMLSIIRGEEREICEVDWLELGKNGKMSFSSEASERKLASYLGAGASNIDAIFRGADQVAQ